MSNQEILTKAIEKAIEGGWYGIYKDGHTWPEAKDLLTMQWDSSSEKFTDGAIEDETTFNVEAIIFNHDFAQALWGEARPTRYDVFPDATGKYGVDGKEGWRYHLMFMVISDDPIKYLGEHI